MPAASVDVLLQTTHGEAGDVIDNFINKQDFRRSMTSSTSPPVRVFTCFFCEFKFDDKALLQRHQESCDLRSLGLESLFSLPPPSRPETDRAEKRNQLENIGLVSKTRAEFLLRPRLADVRCDVIVIDDSEEDDEEVVVVDASRPRSPLKWTQFDFAGTSAGRRRSTRRLSRGSKVASKNMDKLLRIDLCSPLGQRLKGYVDAAGCGGGGERPSSWNDCSQTSGSGCCKTPLSDNSSVLNVDRSGGSAAADDDDARMSCKKMRERFPITFRRSRLHADAKRYCHTYKFTKEHRREFCEAVDTGLNARARRLLRLTRPCLVSIRRCDDARSSGGACNRPAAERSLLRIGGTTGCVTGRGTADFASPNDSCSAAPSLSSKFSCGPTEVEGQGRRPSSRGLRFECIVPVEKCSNKDGIPQTDPCRFSTATASESPDRNTCTKTAEEETSEQERIMQQNDVVAPSSLSCSEYEPGQGLVASAADVCQSQPAIPVPSGAAAGNAAARDDVIDIESDGEDDVRTPAGSGRSSPETDAANNSKWSMKDDLPPLTFHCAICDEVVTCDRASNAKIIAHYGQHGIVNIELVEEVLDCGKKVLKLVEIPFGDRASEACATPSSSNSLCRSGHVRPARPILKSAGSSAGNSGVFGSDDADASSSDRRGRKRKRVTWVDEVFGTKVPHTDGDSPPQQTSYSESRISQMRCHIDSGCASTGDASMSRLGQFGKYSSSAAPESTPLTEHGSGDQSRSSTKPGEIVRRRRLFGSVAASTSSEPREPHDASGTSVKCNSRRISLSWSRPLTELSDSSHPTLGASCDYPSELVFKKSSPSSSSRAENKSCGPRAGRSRSDCDVSKSNADVNVICIE